MTILEAIGYEMSQSAANPAQRRRMEELMIVAIMDAKGRISILFENNVEKEAVYAAYGSFLTKDVIDGLYDEIQVKKENKN